MISIRKLVLNFLMLAIAICFPGSSCASDMLSVADLTAAYNKLDLSINNGDGFSLLNNDQGGLAWGESYILMSYLDMFEATKNVVYLDKFFRHANRIIANTDKDRKIVDYKGRSLVGWGSNKYSNNSERVMFLVHSGMITYPLVKFYSIVTKNGLQSKYPGAKKLVDLSVAALSVFDKNWVYDKGLKEGYYTFERDTPIRFNTPNAALPVPFNQQLVAGSAFITIYSINGNPDSFDKASGLAMHFKNRMRTNKDGAFVWDYWYGEGFKKYSSIETTSYAAIDVDFLILAYKNGIIFTRNDIDKILNTYRKYICKNDGFAPYIDGTDKSFAYIDAPWLELSNYDCSVWDDFTTFVGKQRHLHETMQMLNIAKLLKYYDVCQPKKFVVPANTN